AAGGDAAPGPAVAGDRSVGRCDGRRNQPPREVAPGRVVKPAAPSAAAAAARPPATASLRTRALEEALRIADSEGLDALSIRRLADALGVKGASLYHHFKDKDEILDGVAFLALSDLGPPDDEALPWIDWLLQVARSYRQPL